MHALPDNLPSEPAPAKAAGSDALRAAENAASPHGTRKSTRRLLTALLFLLLLWGGRESMRAWQETQLREAYLPALRDQARQQPFDKRLLVVLAARQAQARQYTEAAQTFQQAVAAGENTPSVWLAWAASQASAGKPTEAGATLLFGMRQPALAPALRAALQRSSVLTADTAPGVAAQTICPQPPHELLIPYTRGSVLNGLAAWYGRRHPGQSGFATRQEWAREQPGSGQAQLLWAEALLKNECYAEAEGAARAALLLLPKSLSAHLDLADALYHEGAGGKAGLEYVTCARAHPDSLRALLGLGQVALDSKMLTMGVEVFSKAVTLAPNAADAWIGLGKAYYNQSLDLNHALTSFETARRLAPERTDFFAAYADVLRAQARYAEAEDLLRKRLAATPTDAPACYYLAVTLLAYNVTPARQSEAEANLRRSLALQPRGPSVVARLGRLLAEEGRYQEALPCLEAAMQADAHDVASAMALSRSCRATGRTQEADALSAHIAALSRYSMQTKELEDRLQRQPLDAALYLKTADLYAAGGEEDKARHYRDAAALLQQHSQQAAHGIRVLRQATSQGGPVAQEPTGSAAHP